MEETVKVHISNYPIKYSGKYFKYLSKEEIDAINYEMVTGVSHYIVIYNKNAEMHSIITIENDAIHIRECDGNFIVMRKWLKKYCDLLGSYTGKKKITFCTRKRGIAALAKSEFQFEDKCNGW